MILDFEKPKKIRSTEEHNETYSSDSGVAGTYVPNMSEADKMKWKAKRITGADPRIEIRITVSGTDPAAATRYGPGNCYAQVLIIVRLDRVIISANGRIVWDVKGWADFQAAVKEAQNILKKGSK